MTIETAAWWSDRRVRWTVLATAVLLLAYVELLWIDAFQFGHLHTGDTNHLVKGARTALDCIGDGVWIGCGHVDGNPNSGVFHYSMLQYIPAALFLALGASEAATLELLARMSVVAFAGCFLIMWYALRQQPRLAALGCLALLGSAATYHATSSFSEMFAGTLFLAAIVAAGTHRPILILLVFWTATLGKETFPPFLLLLGIIAGRDDEDGLLPPARVLAPLIGGVALGVLSFTAFNFFRFSSPWNLTSIQPELVTPTWPLRLEFLAAQWFSPAAGVLWFWPVATVILITSAAFGVLGVVRNSEAVARWLPVMALLGGVLAFTAGLSLWFSPFGWISYGPRLAAPLLPAAVLLCLRTVGTEILGFIDRTVRTTILAAVLWLAMLLAIWPQLGNPWAWHPGIQALMAPTEDCDDSVAVYEGDRFYDCVTSFMWRTSPWVVHRVATANENGATTGRLVGSAASTMLFVLATGQYCIGDRKREPSVASAHQRSNES